MGQDMVRQGELLADPMPGRQTGTTDVALLIDGDNVSPTLAPAILAQARSEGALRIARAYGRAEQLKGWAVPGLRRVIDDAAPGRTDMLLAMEAVDLAVGQGLRRVVIASSDGDFAQLALFLRERGCRVVGIGTAKAPEGFRAACHMFAQLPDAQGSPLPTVTPAPKPAPKPTAAPAPGPRSLPARPVATPQPGRDAFDRLVTAALAANGRALQVTALNAILHKAGLTPISATPHKSWRAYLSSRPDLYMLDPRGPAAMVRLR
jgi:hypothetical protein